MIRLINHKRYTTFRQMADFNETQSDSIRQTLIVASKNKNHSSGISPVITPRIRSVMNDIPDVRMTRNDLSKYINEPTTTLLHTALAIVGWGGIFPINFQNFLQRGTNTLEAAIDEIRTKKHPRSVAYELVKSLKHGPSKNWSLFGVAPAFYTKVVFFITRGTPNAGYIMDQFSARAVNYLFNNSDIYLNENGAVERNNSPAVYEQFCKRIEAIADDLKGHGIHKTPEQVEYALFNPNSEWREHLTQNDNVALNAKAKVKKAARKPAKKQAPKKPAKKVAEKAATKKKGTKSLRSK
jgi:hypothetical protein